jgi:methylmalonyl-CoA mutase N-terminal domain/subunit
VEQEVHSIMEEIESQGGMRKALDSGWVDRRLDEAALKVQQEVETGERIVVGLNKFQEKEEKASVTNVHRVSEASEAEQRNRIKRLKESRDVKKVKEALLALKSRAEVGEKENLMPAMIEAARQQATLSEVLGTVRQVMGESYDPLGAWTHPFF